MGTVTWADEEIDQLTLLWSTHTARQISNIMGKSRNAILGKANRLCLPRKTPNAAERAHALKSRPHLRNKKVAPPERAQRPLMAPMPNVGHGLSIMELEAHHCRAVMGRGEDGLARYCGETCVPRIRQNSKGELLLGLDNRPVLELPSFCEWHSSLYYQRI